jgi:hypothetical protein
VVRNDHGFPFEIGGSARCGPAFPAIACSLWISERREPILAVAIMVDSPEGSREVYEQVRAHLGPEKPAGGIFHVAGPSPKGGWRVLEVWESEKAANRFFEERLVPALEALGLPEPSPQREFWPVHSAMK